MSKQPARPVPYPGPRVQWIQKAKTTDGPDAVFLSSAYGLAPDDWQAPILHAWLGRRRDGKWCHGRCGLAVPRQNGKNGVIEIRELFGMVVLGEAILHTAHEVKTARKAFKRLKHFFGNRAADDEAKFPELNALVLEVRSTNGQEAIILKDVRDEDGNFVRRGGSVEFVARSSGSGRGFTVDLLVLDEAQHLDDDELEAIRPALSSAPLGNPQLIYAGTPPNPDKGETGEVWTRVRKMSGRDKRLCWIEYGAPDGPLPDIDDIDLLYETNPALELQHANGAFGLTMEVVRDERGDLSEHGYARERYGWWGNPLTARYGAIHMPTWINLKVAVDSQPTRATIVADVSPDLDWTSVSLGSEGPAARTLVLSNRDEGTAGGVQRIVDLTVDLADVVEVALTPTAQVFSAALTEAGVEHKLLTNADLGRACAYTQQAIRNGALAHVNQQVLNDAVRNASTRYVGDAQHWDRRDRRVDISALVSGSVAAHRWDLLTAKPDVPPPAPVRAGRAKVRAGSIADAGF